MSWRLLPLAAAAAIAAACNPQPRSADYFIAHQEEASRVVAACRRGDHRGDECMNARAGVAAAESAKRMQLYQRAF